MILGPMHGPRQKYDWPAIEPDIRFYRDIGLSWEDIGEKLGIKGGTVYQHARRSMMHYVRDVRGESRTCMILKDAKSGMTGRDIAKKYGVRADYVSRLKVKYGISYHPASQDEILCLLESGMNITEAASFLRISRSALTKRRKRNPEFRKLSDEAIKVGKALNKELAG